VLHVEFFLGGLYGDDLLKGDGFSGSLVDPAVLEGEEVVVGEDDPAPEWGKAYCRQLLKKRDCFCR
jgi:hypothetical protein